MWLMTRDFWCFAAEEAEVITKRAAAAVSGDLTDPAFEMKHLGA